MLAQAVRPLLQIKSITENEAEHNEAENSVNALAVQRNFREGNACKCNAKELQRSSATSSEFNAVIAHVLPAKIGCGCGMIC